MASGLVVIGAGVGSAAGCALGVVFTSVVFVIKSSFFPGTVNRRGRAHAWVPVGLQFLPGTNPRPAGRRRHAEGPESMKSRECASPASVMGNDPDESWSHPFTSFLD